MKIYFNTSNVLNYKELNKYALLFSLLSYTFIINGKKVFYVFDKKFKDQEITINFPI
jgi:N-glycosylase/DNA lyase